LSYWGCGPKVKLLVGDTAKKVKNSKKKEEKTLVLS
jgi:hypothetical protein